MKCKVIYVGPSSRVEGFHNYKCSRPGCWRDIHTDHPLEKVTLLGDCTGKLFLSDWREAVTAIMEGLGIDKATAIVWFVRWKAKGSPLDSLPSGIPAPDLVPAPAPIDGPGTELETILREAGAPEGCQICKDWRDQMNRGGVEWCKAHRAEIITRLKQATYETWISDSLKVGFSLMREPWFSISDPLGSLVEEAIRRAELTEKKLPPTAPATSQ